MRKKFRLFVGYFKSSVNKKVLVGILKKNCPDVRFIDLYECARGETGKAYCCKLTFDSKASLKQSAKILRRLRIKGHSLVVRDWAERRSFNERRDINWRTVQYANGEGGREKDRRRYRDPINLFLKK